MRYLVALFDNSQINVIKALQQANPEWQVSPQVFSKWYKGEVNVPAHWCNALEMVSQGIVTREDLRPDIFKRQFHGGKFSDFRQEVNVLKN